MPFRELFGNKRITNILQSYLTNNIIPYSIIFSGPVSANIIGFARSFAKALNCLESQNDFCDRCEHCLEINKEIFPDVLVLSRDGQFYKKEQITFMIEDNFKKPLKGNRKVYILKDAHRMNENSANSFLKVLEEPALSNVYILLTDNLRGLLPTIKSRCQILNFSQPARSEIEKFLKEKGYDQNKAKLISHLSLGDCSVLDRETQNEFMKKRSNVLTILEKLIRKKEVEDVLLDLYNRSPSREKFLNYFRQLINLISLLLRDIMVLKIDENSDFLINVDFKEKLMELSQYITIEKNLFLIKRMELLFRDIQRNLNTRVLILEFIRNYMQKEVENV
jgi:DNA polymerase-3 subunit delta'